MTRYPAIIILSLFYLGLHAQPIPINDNAVTSRYPFINTVFNRVLNSNGLDSFYQKLRELKNTGQGVVNIVHIGDSHIQADFLSDEVRDGFQELFGNAGRGLVFPHQLASSNAAGDIIASSNTRWAFNRVAHPEISLPVGVSGFGLRTAVDGASINISLRQDFRGSYTSFNKLRFFLDSSSSNAWLVEAEPNDEPIVIRKGADDTMVFQEISFAKQSTSLSMVSLPGSTEKDFYGVSLENSNPGVIYHTVGVNGARYDQYNEAPLFWKQLPGLNADLYIISLGTNEAQRAAFSETIFLREFNLFISKIHEASPHASILITTAPDSYKGRTSNRVLQQLNQSIINACNAQYIPCWDLYRITNGFGSAYSWSRRGLMNRDRIHFTAEGYRLQGVMLFNALAKGFNNYVSGDPRAR